MRFKNGTGTSAGNAGGRAASQIAVCFFAAALLLVAIPASASRHRRQAAGGATHADVRELLRLETVWNDAQMKNDADALAALWADDIEIAVPRMPVMNKTDALNFARSNRMKFENYTTSNVRARVYGDAAVVTGKLQRTRRMGEREVPDDWRFTKTYVRTNGRWKVVAFHASEAAQG